MIKKAYTAAPAILVTEVQLQSLMAGSPKVVIEGEDDPIVYDPTPGNAGGGLSRRQRDLWEEEEEDDE